MPGRLVVRRIPGLNPYSGQHSLFDTWRFHAFFTTNALDTVAADKTRRRHAIVEQVHADLKQSALVHLQSGKFNADAAWLVCVVIAFNLTRAAATLTGRTLGQGDHSHHRTESDYCPRPSCPLRSTGHLAPARAVALGNRVDCALHPRLRSTPTPAAI